MEKLSILFPVYLAVMSLAAIVMYFADKVKAKRGKWRISEKALLTVGFIGGAIGALFAMKTFRHKTKHYYFYVINVIGLVWQIAAFGVILYLGL